MSKTLTVDVEYSNVATGPSAESYMVDSDRAGINKFLNRDFSGPCGLHLAQSIAALLRGLDCCNTNTEIVIRPRHDGDANVHRVTIYNPERFGIDVSAGVTGEQDEGDG